MNVQPCVESVPAIPASKSQTPPMPTPLGSLGLPVYPTQTVSVVDVENPDCVPFAMGGFRTGRTMILLSRSRSVQPAVTVVLQRDEHRSIRGSQGDVRTTRLRFRLMTRSSRLAPCRRVEQGSGGANPMNPPNAAGRTDTRLELGHPMSIRSRRPEVRGTGSPGGWVPVYSGCRRVQQVCSPLTPIASGN